MGVFIRLTGYANAEAKKQGFLIDTNYHLINQNEFKKIPGSPLAYWVSKSILMLFGNNSISSLCTPRCGMIIGNNSLFVRSWFEISKSGINLYAENRNDAKKSGLKWFPYQKGGGFRKWYGNKEQVVNWENDGMAIRGYRDENGNYPAHAFNDDYLFRPNTNWSKVSSTDFCFRYTPRGSHLDDGGAALFADSEKALGKSLAFLNSVIAKEMLHIVNPTLNIQAWNIGNLPLLDIDSMEDIISEAICIAKADWDLRETSWDFLRLPLITDYTKAFIAHEIDVLLKDYKWPSAFGIGRPIELAEREKSFKVCWNSMFQLIKTNEETINRSFIESYGLQEDITPEVPYAKITILQEELTEMARHEERLEFDESVLARQFVSYGFGCLIGRYSVEKDGFILADAGATLLDYKARIPNARFLPDEDGILPLTDEDDFSDDLPTAFKSWLRFISGSYYDDNLQWIEDRLGKDLRSFFDRDFYKDHIKRYKSRPIYWMVSSPSGAFRALIYLHRYTKDTVGKILNDYVRPYRTKIDQKIRGLESVIDSSGSSAGEKTKAKKRLAQLEKYRTEIEAWEKESLYPLALKRVELDLDDGVKVNYRKLEGILEPVKQLEAKEEE